MNVKLHPFVPSILTRDRTHRPVDIPSRRILPWIMNPPARNRRAFTEAPQRRPRSADISQLELSTVNRTKYARIYGFASVLYNSSKTDNNGKRLFPVDGP